MASPRKANATAALLAQVNRMVPNRSKTSDGWIGDAAHRARPSDHNPNAAGVVCAIDITHDPQHGFDSYCFAELLRQRRDPRINYVISAGQIFSSTVNPWMWRKYTGSNSHHQHMHMSVKQNKAFYDDAREWDLKPGEDGRKWDENKGTPPDPNVKVQPTLRKNSPDSANVKLLQTLLGLRGNDVDGVFGPKTEALVKEFQKANKYTVDGVVGPQTWAGLTKDKPKPVK